MDAVDGKRVSDSASRPTRFVPLVLVIMVEGRSRGEMISRYNRILGDPIKEANQGE